jgi:CubicO group peptidase (beta-lactamase class C family)
MNNGIYNSTQILKKETVELMHAMQSDNQLKYGLAWYHQPIRPLPASGHNGDLLGVDTWMLYNQTKNIGVIYLANGNPYYGGILPFGGWFLEILILYSLFTKEKTFREEMQQEFTISSDLLFMTPLIVPRPMSYRYNDN